MTGDEKLKVLNVDKINSRIRVLREAEGTTGSLILLVNYMKFLESSQLIVDSKLIIHTDKMNRFISTQ